MRHFAVTFFLAVFAAALAPLSVFAQDWPQFLGPDGNGRIPPAASPPLRWSETENITWKTAIHGRGWSSPVLAGNKIWLTSATEDGKERYALCIDADTGKILRDILLLKDDAPQNVNAINTHASPSCVIDGERVFVHYGYAGTFCLDTNSGNTIWERRDLKCDHMMGAGGSPIVYENLLIFNVDGADVQYTIALDKRNGKDVWKTGRSFDLTPLNPDVRKAFSTPIIVEIDCTKILISAGAQAIYGYDPGTGKEIWRFDYAGGYSNVAKPALWKNLLIVNSGFDNPKLFCVPLDKQGKLADSDIKWICERNISPVPTPAIVGDFLYNVSATGIGSCINLDDGSIAWTKRFGGGYWASPLCTSERIYMFDDIDSTTVIAADPEKCEILAKNTLESGCMATPAVSGKAIFLRTKTHLYRIEEQ